MADLRSREISFHDDSWPGIQSMSTFDKFSAKSLPRIKRVNRHLLDMGKRLDHFNQNVSHRLVTGTGGNPCPGILLIDGQSLQAGWRIISDGSHTEGSECFAGCDFDVPQLREVFCFCFPDHPASQPDVVRRIRWRCKAAAPRPKKITGDDGSTGPMSYWGLRGFLKNVAASS
jgi:hypothetical protein